MEAICNPHQILMLFGARRLNEAPVQHLPSKVQLKKLRVQRIPSMLFIIALVAQRIEHLTTDQKVGGSSPSKRTSMDRTELVTLGSDGCFKFSRKTLGWVSDVHVLERA